MLAQGGSAEYSEVGRSESDQIPEDSCLVRPDGGRGYITGSTTVGFKHKVHTSAMLISPVWSTPLYIRSAGQEILCYDSYQCIIHTLTQNIDAYLSGRLDDEKIELLPLRMKSVHLVLCGRR